MSYSNMSLNDAEQLINILLMKVIKSRSNHLEALGYKDIDFDEIDDIERYAIMYTQPGLFGNNPSILELLVSLQEKGDKLEPSDMYNLLYYVNKDEYLYRVLGMIDPALNDDSLPQWLSGWKK